MVLGTRHINGARRNRTERANVSVFRVRGTDDRFVIVSLAKFHRFIISVTFVHGESAFPTIPKYINCIASTAPLVNHRDGSSRLSWIHWKELFRRLPGSEDSQWA